MCDTVFALSQRGGYHFECPSKWCHNKLPERITELFVKDEIASVHSMALGADHSFFISYKGKDGSNHIEGRGLPPQLHAFLFEKKDGAAIREFPNIRVTLGAYNESYFVTDGSASQWLNLPPGLAKAIEGYRKPGGGWLDAPRLVALGAHGDYLLVTKQNAANWSLGHYRSLRYCIQTLGKEQGGLSIIKNVAMHAYRLECYILQSINGAMMAENLPPHMEAGFESIKFAIKEDTDTKARHELDLATATVDLARARQAAATQAALLQRINQINRINQASQMNMIANMFNSFLINSNI